MMRHALLLSAATSALPLMAAPAQAEARELIEALTRTANADDATTVMKIRAAAAWEDDMQSVRDAIAGALHAGGEDALRSLRVMLPGLLIEISRAPQLAAVLLEESFGAFVDVLLDGGEIRTGNVATLDETPQVTDAMRRFRERQVFETDLGSAELRGFSRQLRDRSLFSARTTNAHYLQEVQTVVDDILAGRENMSTGRWRLMKKLKQLGYDPAIGFPDDLANVPPAEAGSLQDLSSAQRIDLLLETNVRMARGYAQHVAGSRPADVAARPAWELKRLYLRDVPRGSEESHSVGWQRRWQDAAESVNWEGVARGGERMVARKNSPIWEALGDGVGGYTDTLQNPFPPFAFRSGYAWSAVTAAEWERLSGFQEEGSQVAPPENVQPDNIQPAPRASLTPGQREVRNVFQRLGDTIKNALRRVLGL
jgi:hypothetical protein